MLNSIQEVVRVLEEAERLGEDVDEPEGSRYIQISETLVNEMLAVLRCSVKVPFGATVTIDLTSSTANPGSSND